MKATWTYRHGKQQTTLNGHERTLDHAEIKRDLRFGNGLADGGYLLLSNLPSPFAEERSLSRHGLVSCDLFCLRNPLYVPEMKVVRVYGVRNSPDGQRTGAWVFGL
jgi:hypothetical protein